MSFNIRGTRKDGINSWDRRAELNARVIERCAPDLIGFQELQMGNQHFYERRLTGYEWLMGPEYENRKPHAFNAIYWNPERLELVENGGFWLSEMPEKHSRSWGARQIRSANWAKFQILSDGSEFVHLNTHLDHGKGSTRQSQAKFLVQWLEEMKLGRFPVLITGDFNAEPGKPVHKIFADAGFEDAHLLAESPPARTFHRFQGEEFKPRNPDREGRIDWLLARGGAGVGRWTSHECAVVRDAEPPLYPSDHYPVLAELSLETG